MPIFRIGLAAVSACLAVLYICDACARLRGDTALAVADIVAGRWPAPDDFRSAAAISSAAAIRSAAAIEQTPAARVRETFAMFIPRDERRPNGIARPQAASARPQG